MSPALRNMLVSVGLFSLGVGVYVFTPQPATRTMLELKDAGILDGQRLVLECPERITKQTKRRINANQPGVLRPAQSYAHVARTARCFGDSYLDGGTGNCLRPSDGGTLAPYITERLEWSYTPSDGGAQFWFPNLFLATVDLLPDGGPVVRIGTVAKDPELIVPSLRVNLSGVDLDAGIAADDGGDSDTVDDSLQYANSSCSLLTCPQYDALVDAGQRANPYASSSFCGGLNRLALVPSPCMLPNCFTLADGGWDDNAVVDCRFGGIYAEQDGGPHYRGCNVGAAAYSIGAACLPVECSVVSGDVPQEWL